MFRTGGSLAAVALAVVLVAGAGTVGAGIGDRGVPNDRGELDMENAMTGETEVTVDVNCTEGTVELTAPEGASHRVTVAVANVTSTESDVSSSTVGGVEGNETFELDGEGIAFVFVQDSSSEETVASAVRDCANEANASATATTETTEATATESDDVPEVEISCNDSEVRFVAPEGTEYAAKVTALSVSPDSTSSQSATRTLEGNATASVGEDQFVAVFASTGDLGDEETVSVFRNCASIGGSDDANRTTRSDDA